MTCTRTRDYFVKTWKEQLQEAYAGYNCVGEGCADPRICNMGGCFINPAIIGATDTMHPSYGQSTFDWPGWRKCLYDKFISANLQSRADVAAFVERYKSVHNDFNNALMDGRNTSATSWHVLLSRVTSTKYNAERWLFLEVHKKDANHAIYEGFIPYLNGIASNPDINIDERIEAATYAEDTVREIREGQEDFAGALKIATTVFGAFTGLGYVTSAALKAQKVQQVNELKELQASASQVAPILESGKTQAVSPDQMSEVQTTKEEEENELGLAAVAGIAGYLFLS